MSSLVVGSAAKHLLFSYGPISPIGRLDMIACILQCCFAYLATRMLFDVIHNPRLSPMLSRDPSVFDLLSRDRLPTFLDPLASHDVLALPTFLKLGNLGGDILWWDHLMSLMGMLSLQCFVSSQKESLPCLHHLDFPPLPSPTKDTTLCGLSLITPNLKFVICHSLQR